MVQAVTALAKGVLRVSGLPGLQAMQTLPRILLEMEEF